MATIFANATALLGVREGYVGRESGEVFRECFRRQRT